MRGQSRKGADAIILAGGKGTRLAPYTTVLPKPLMPLGEGPILDVVMKQLGHYGFTNITLAVGYLAHLIEAVFQDGARLGVSLQYHHEEHPLGTVGPLALMDNLNERFLMMNGDVLTTLDYRAFFAAHIASGNALTVATHVRTVCSDYGVLELDGHNGATRRVSGFREKPAIDHSVSMGVYVLDRRVCEFIPAGERFDLPDLIWRLLEAGLPVGAYCYDGFWLDIGRPEDYAFAVEQFEKFRDEFLPMDAPALLTNGNGNGNGAHGNGNGRAHGNGNGNGRAHGNGNGNGNGRVHGNGNGNGNGNGKTNGSPVQPGSVPAATTQAA